MADLLEQPTLSDGQPAQLRDVEQKFRPPAVSVGRKADVSSESIEFIRIANSECNFCNLPIVETFGNLALLEEVRAVQGGWV